MKGFVFFAFVGLLLVIAVSSASEFPLAKICSIQGSGTATLIDDDDREYIGTVTMKRVYDTARYDVILTEKETGRSRNCTIVARPDLANVYAKCGDSEGESDMVNLLSTYSYDADFKPVADKEYNCYSCRISPFPQPFAAFLMSADDKKLIGEYIKRGRDKYTFLYSEVKSYVHDKVDDAFSIPGFDRGRSSVCNNATQALSSQCPENPDASSSASASVFVPSVLALLVALALVLF